jgi:hypothetical protein
MQRNSYALLIKLCEVESTGKKVPKELSTRQSATLDDDLQSRHTKKIQQAKHDLVSDQLLK